jgi:hypothetical protein
LLVIVKPFQPSLLFVIKATALLIGAPKKCFTLR